MKTTVDGKEIKIVGKNDISIAFTQKVNEMLNQGFVFYFYSGTQGEEGKVCLTKDGGKTVYVFYAHIERESFGERWYERCENVYVLTAEKFEDCYPKKTLWLGKGEKFYEEKFYCIDSSKGVYVETIEEFKLIDKITQERIELRYRTNGNNLVKLSSKVNKAALKIIRNKKGYKSVSLKDIDCVVHRIGYGYTFNFTRESGKASFSIKGRAA